ncbi:MAG: Pr6Pr family membrane protein [Propionibacteriaceae bacterium]
MSRTVVVGVLRVGLAIAIGASVMAQAQATARSVGGTAALANYLSYFTVDSSVLAVVVLLIGAASAISGRGAESRRFTLARAAVVTYLVLIGVVYNLVLRGIPAQGETVGWSNEILHVVVPVALLLDWVLAPGRQRLEYHDVRVVLVVPIAWLVYTLIRGPLVLDPFVGTPYWYPYPFLDPVASTGGYGSVAAYVVALTAIVVAFGLGVIRISRPGRHTAHLDPSDAPR